MTFSTLSVRAFAKMLSLPTISGCSISIFMLFSFLSFSQTGQKAVLVKDIMVGTASSAPTNFTTVGNTVYFTANDGTGSAIWKSDGTTEGTIKVGAFLSNPQGYNGKMYYATKYLTPSQDRHQIVLWAYDGNTSVVVDTIKVSYGQIISIKLSTIGSNLVIDADFNFNFPSNESNIVRFLSKGIKNTTRESGNAFVRDGGCGTYIYSNFYLADTLAFYDFTTSFCGNPSSNYLYSIKKGKLWENRLFSAYKLIFSLGTIGNRLIFVAPPNANDPFTPTPLHLYSIGIDGDSVRLASNMAVNPQAYPPSISQSVVFNNKIYFRDGNNKIWETNGTAAGTVAITDGTTTALPLSMSNPIVLADGLYFYDTYNNEFRIWKISTTGNIRKIMSIPTTTDRDIRLANLNNELWQFTSVNSSVTTESPVFLYKIDVVNGTRQAVGAANGMDIYDTNKYTTANTGAGLKLFVNANDSSATNANPKGNEPFIMSLEPSIANCNNDDVAPYFGYCPASIVKNITADRDTTWYPIPTVFDNCSTPSVSLQTSSVYNNAPFPTGNQVIISKDSTARFEYTATDAKGNTGKCIFTVKILKTCVPSSSLVNSPCPRDTTISTVDACTRVSWIVPTATDNCGNVSNITQTQGLPSGSCFAIGSYTINYEKPFGGGCSFNVVVIPSVSSCRTSDSLALVSLYNNTNGANWTNKWNLNMPINTWFGITLNANGCVQSIVLDSNRLAGTLPNLNLYQLTRLILNGNHLNGPIPNFTLPNLQELNLSNTEVNGTIPNFNLPNLKRLSLFTTQLVGPLPNFNLPNLEYMGISSFLFSGTIPNFNLPNLKELYIYNSFLTGNIPNFNTPLLEMLYLTGNRLTGSIPSFNYPNLRELNLANNQLTGGIPNFNLPNLQYLNLSQNPLGGSLPNFNQVSFQEIQLNNNQLSGGIPNFNLPNLKILSMSNNPLGGTIPNFNLPSIEKIFLTNTYLSGALPNFNFPNLHTLYINSNFLTGTISNFNLPNIQYLVLSENRLTGGMPNFTGMPNLYFFYASNNQLTGTIPDFGMTKLQTLGLNNNQFSGSIPDFKLPNLYVLYLYNNLLSGCIPQSFKFMCGKNVIISNNPNLITDDFDAFCNNNLGLCNDACATDAISPIFQTCPSNINLTTAGTNAVATWVTPTATDNCTPPSVVGNYSSGFSFPLGTATVLYTARDIKNNTATCSFNVSVTQQTVTRDVCTNPTANVVGVSGAIVVRGIKTASAVIQIFNANWSPVYNQQVSSDSVTIPNMAVGTYNVKVTVLETGGRWPAVCSVTVNNVIVNASTNPCDTDTQLPILSNCPQNISITTTGTTAIATWTAPTATDNCGTPSVSSTYNSGLAFPIGTTTVIYTATDAKGNKTTCSFNVVVTLQANTCSNNALNFDGNNDYLETLLPTIPANIDFTMEASCISTSTETGCTGAFRRLMSLELSSSVNRLELGECGGQLTLFYYVNGGKTGLYQIPNTNTIRDGNFHHVAAVKKSDSLFIYYDGIKVLGVDGALSMNNVARRLYVGRWGGGSEYWLGTIDEVRIWNYALTTSQVQTVKSCQLVGNETGLILYFPFNQGASSGNNAAVNTALDKSPSGINTNLTNFALSGATSNWVCSTLNLSQGCIANPCDNDTQLPVISNCPTNITLTTTGTTAVATWTTPTVTDNCGTPSVSSTYNSGFAFPVGTTTVVYTATDAKGNKATCRFNVVVTRTVTTDSCLRSYSMYGFLPAGNGCQGYINGADNGKLHLYSKNLVDGFYLDISQQEFFSSKISVRNGTRTAPAGISFYGCDTTNWLYFKASGINQSGGTYNSPTEVTNMYVRAKIVATSPTADTLLVETNLAPNIKTWLLKSDIVRTNCQNCYSNDNTPPTINCPTTVLTYTIPGLREQRSEWVARDLNVTATDNCGGSNGVGLSFSPAKTYINYGQSYTYTMVAFDSAGNKSTPCIFTVKAQNPPCTYYNGKLPVLSNCPVDITLQAPQGASCATATWALPTAIQTLNTVTIPVALTSNFQPNYCFPIGTTTVTYTATDSCGNKATCSFNVVVTSPTVVRDVCINPTANIRGASGVIIVTGIKTASAVIQIFNANWSPVYNQQVSGDSVTIPNMAVGSYNVKVTVLGTGGKWPAVCSVTVNNVAVISGTDPCATDTEAPRFLNCLPNLNLLTSGTTAIATWTSPTVVDNCTTPSLSSNYSSGFAFPVGTTIVTFTASDAKGNKTTCSFNVNVTQNVSCRQRDSLILVDIYNNMGGGNWSFNNWDLSTPINTWYGVILNANGCVVDLGLWLAIGNLRPSIGNLSELQALHLNGNGTLTGTLPSELGNLSKLKFIEANSNKFTGSIPASLGNLTNLEDLRLYNNQLSGSIPPELGKLKKLKLLLLYQNKLTGEIPSSLGTLDSMYGLILNNNLLTGKIPNSFGSLKSLELLDAKNNLLSDTLPRSLVSMPKLSRLYLSNNLFSGCIPSEYKLLCGKEVDLSNNPNLLGGGDWAAFCSNNTGACVVVTPPTTCKRYTVQNTNDICGGTWKPYSLKLITNTQTQFLHAEQVTIETNGLTATLKGTFRDPQWKPVQVSIMLSGGTTIPPSINSPRMSPCSGDGTGYTYFTAMAGTFVMNGQTLTIANSAALLQIGIGANMQNKTDFGASGYFNLSDGTIGDFGFKMLNETVCSGLTPSLAIGQKSILDLEAHTIFDKVELQWVNNTSINNDYFEIEKADANGVFKAINIVNETHHDMQLHSYTYTDAQPSAGDNFYRIKSVMQDGSVLYSAVKKVVVSDAHDAIIAPNPAQDNFNIYLKKQDNKPTKILIYNSIGILIQEKNVEANTNTPLSISSENWAKGTYFIRIQTQGKREIMKKIVITQ